MTFDDLFDDEEKSPVSDSQPPQGEQTDRVNGEYHYKNGYTQRIYSDAHYVRADETTVPPRYYTPPEKPQKERRASSKKKGVGLGAMIAACLICALLGGLGGGALVGTVMDSRVAALEENVSALAAGGKQALPAPVLSSGATVSASSNGLTLSAGDIYDLACQQVVGVTTEVTYTNFFGMTSSAALSGSGFIISEDGYILTNYHVVEDAVKGKLDSAARGRRGLRGRQPPGRAGLLHDHRPRQRQGPRDPDLDQPLRRDHVPGRRAHQLRQLRRPRL